MTRQPRITVDVQGLEPVVRFVRAVRAACELSPLVRVALREQLEHAGFCTADSKEEQAMERLYFPTGDEIRADDGDGDANGDSAPVIRGYAAVFNRAVDLGLGFREQISPGAFARSIAQDDIRAFWNHDSGQVLGRKRNNTLRLEEDDKGLKIEIDPPETQAGRDAVVSIRRKDVSGMSIGFAVRKDGEEWNDDRTLRTLRAVRLFEVSPVSLPAYKATSVSVRSALAASGVEMVDTDILIAALYRERLDGASLTDEECNVLHRTRDLIERALRGNRDDGRVARELARLRLLEMEVE